MVYLYVQGADDRAQAEQVPVEVLKVIAQIEPGETLADAQAAQKVELQPVPSEQVLVGALTSVGDLGTQVALQRIFVGEQVTASKFGSAGEQDALTLDDGEIAVSVTLSDTGRVAGFVNPGAEVALFFNGDGRARAATTVCACCCRASRSSRSGRPPSRPPPRRRRRGPRRSRTCPRP